MTWFFQLAVLCFTSFFSYIPFIAGSPASCLEGNCFNGYGKYQYANGNRYIGTFSGGKPHGDGILYCANGNKYLGQWEKSWRQGKGKYIFNEGHEYTGEFRRNKFHGTGEMSYANGDRYEGQWQNNLPNGEGTYFFKKGARYQGRFRDGSFHGPGTMFYVDGSKFTGNWQFSKKHGTGTYYSAQGKASTGDWIFGQPLHAMPDEAIQEEEGPLKAPPAAIPADEVTEKSRFAANASPAPDYRSSVRIWAVVVGVANYAHMPSLRYTDDDAYHFYAFLKSPEGGALPDDQVEVLVDDNATRENIIHAMEKTFLQADENDVVLFYFSGHGVEGAFIPVDFDGFDNRLYHTELRDIIRSSKARHKIVVGDACHAGSLYGADIGGELFASRRSLENMIGRYYKAFEDTNGGLALLLSSKGREVSLEDGGLRSGVFSHFLIRGLKGEADTDGDKIVTVEEAYAFIYRGVYDYTVGAQTPVLTGEFDGRMPVSVLRY